MSFKQIRLEKLLLGTGILIGIVVFLVFLSDLSGFLVDDSFIFYRYADNIAQGAGFVFNTGESPGEGFTSWIWVLLLSLARFLGLDPVTASKFLGIFFLLLSTKILYLLVLKVNNSSEREGRITALICAGIFLLNYRLMAHSVSGMETSLYIFALVLLIYTTTLTWFRESSQDIMWLLLGLTVTFVFLVRPEGILAGAISMLVLCIKHKKSLLKTRIWFYLFLGLLLPLSLFFLWKTIYFGYPLPISFYHKVSNKGIIHPLAWRHFLAFIREYAWLIFPASLFSTYTLFIRKKNIFWYYTLLFFLMVLVYLNFLPVMNYAHRFYIPYILLLIVILSPGLSQLIHKLNCLSSSLLRIFLLFFVGLVLVVGMNIHIPDSRKMIRNWEKMVSPKIYRARLGKILSDLPADVVLANTEMGVIPFYSGLICLDMAGLTDPVIAHEGLTMGYLLQRNTDIILFPRDVKRMSRKQMKSLSRNYDRIFFSKEFKQQFEFLGSFIAWPDKRSKYYLYVNKKSSKYDSIWSWRKRYGTEFDS